MAMEWTTQMKQGIIFTVTFQFETHFVAHGAFFNHITERVFSRAFGIVDHRLRPPYSPEVVMMRKREQHPTTVILTCVPALSVGSTDL